MTEGGLIKNILDFSLSSLTDFAHDSKFFQELQANGTSIEQYLNKTQENGTMSEYDRRYHNRYGSHYGGGYGG
jgi:hypothetical protein